VSAQPATPPLRVIRRLGPLARLVTAIVVASLVVALIVVLAGQSPTQAASGLYDGALGSSASLEASLAQMTPLLFAALGFTFAFRAGVFNAGGQGQFVMGAFCAALAGFASPLAGLPAIVHVPLVVLAGAAGGALWSLPPILLKVYLGTNEILTTLMMSYIAFQLNDWLVQDVFRAKALQPGSNEQTPSLAASAHFPILFASSQVTFLLIVGIVAAVLIWLFFRRTVLGFELDLLGQGAEVARSAGVATRKAMIIAMLVSGALAGIAGAAVVGGIFQAAITPFDVPVGFNGILAALLAANQPLLIPFASFFFGALQEGGLGLQIYTPISQHIADVLTAVVIVFASARSLPRVRRLRKRVR
jgi:ABC-type uncharacterized transport system permease subunit